MRIKTSNIDKQRAFELYKQGVTIKEISEQLDIRKGTLASWVSREKWGKKKLDVTVRNEDTCMYERFNSYIMTNSANFLDCVTALLSVAHFLSTEIVKQANKEKDPVAFLVGRTDLLRDWTRIIKDLAIIQQSVIPEANEEIMNEFIKDVREMKANKEKKAS